MKIVLKAEERKFTIPIPNGLIFNGVASNVAAKVISKHTDLGITAGQIKSLGKGIKEARKVLKGKPLIYLKSADGGEEVTITL